jgi:c-di-GMP-binding flagellar brake protein YcgR
MTIVQFDREALGLPVKAVADFLTKLDDASDFEIERRASPRQAVVMQVAVVPVDRELKQCGDSFLALSKDISAGGIGLLHTRAITASHVVVELTARDGNLLQLLAKVVRCQAVHRFYEIGLQFVTRLAGE